MSTKNLIPWIAVGLGAMGFLPGKALAGRQYAPTAKRFMQRDPEPTHVGRDRNKVCPKYMYRKGMNLHGVPRGNPIKADGTADAGISECFTADPLPPGQVCNAYESDDEYAGFNAECVCRCMPTDFGGVNDQIRSCLACMDNKGVAADDAHGFCYEAAGLDRKGKLDKGVEVACTCTDCAVRNSTYYFWLCACAIAG